VPVWINVRTTVLPKRGWVPIVLLNASTDASGRVSDAFSQGFFIRSVVLAPDGDTLLNGGSTSLTGTVATSAVMGGSSYTSVDPGDYLSMLGKALRRLKAGTAHAAAW
jgi:hypothetical protein